MKSLYIKQKKIYLGDENNVNEYQIETNIENTIKSIDELKKEKEIFLILEFTNFYIKIYDVMFLKKKDINKLIEDDLSSEIEDYNNKKYKKQLINIDDLNQENLIIVYENSYIKNIKQAIKKQKIKLSGIQIDIFIPRETSYFIGDNISCFVEKDSEKIKDITYYKEEQNFKNDNILEFKNEKEDIKKLFQIKSNPIILGKKVKFNNKKQILLISVIIIIFCYFFYVKRKEEINILEEISQKQTEIKNLEDLWIEENNKEIDTYEDEIKELDNIEFNNNNLYEVIIKLIEESEENFYYTNIKYDKKFWNIVGVSSNYNQIKDFENNMSLFESKKLNYIKNEDENLSFDYELSDKK